MKMEFQIDVVVSRTFEIGEVRSVFNVLVRFSKMCFKFLTNQI